MIRLTQLPSSVLIICYLAMVFVTWCFQYFVTAWLIWFAFVPFLIVINRTKPNSFWQFLVPFLLVYASYILSFNWYLAIPRNQFLIFLATTIESFVASISYIIYLFIARKTKNLKTIWLLPFLLVFVEYIWRHLNLMPPIVLGHTQASLTYISQYVDILGVEGASFFVMLINVCVYRSLTLKHTFLQMAIRFLLILAFPFVYSLIRIYQFEQKPAQQKGLSVSLFRLNIHLDSDNMFENKRTDLLRLERDIYLTDSVSYFERKEHKMSDLFVWHESAFSRSIPKVDAYIRKIIKEDSVPVLTGIEQIDKNSATPFVNGTMVFYPDGSMSDFYIKMNFVNIWEDGYLRGKKYVLHPIKNKSNETFRLATPICFEQFMPEHWAAFRRAGADMFVQVCFETWFRNGIGSEPGISNMTALRCIENKCYGARTSNGGAAAFFDPLGKRYNSTVKNEVVKDVLYKSNFGLTIYTQFPYLSILMLLVGFFVVFILITNKFEKQKAATSLFL